MNRTNFSALIVSILLAAAFMSCKKDTIQAPPPTQIDTTHHIPVPQPTEIEVTIYSWNDFGNGYYSSTLNNVLAQLNTSHSTSIKVYLVSNGNAESLDKPITFDNGILSAEVVQTDVNIRYQSFSRTPPSARVTIKIVAL